MSLGLCAFLIVILLLAMGKGLSSDIPIYRAGNALYIHQQLEQVRLAALTFQEIAGGLPGDAAFKREAGGTGDNDGRIEAELGEDVRFFADLYALRLTPDQQVRIRGRALELRWMTIESGGIILAEGNYFRLPGIDAREAAAFDERYDDGDPEAGAVFVKSVEAGRATLLAPFLLYD